MMSDAQETKQIDWIHNLVIIGGGPGGMSILVRAMRTGQVYDLLRMRSVHQSTCDTDLRSQNKTKSTKESVDATYEQELGGTKKERSKKPVGEALPKAQDSNSQLCGGVVVVEASDDNVVGRGRLGDYLINSNTWAGRFVTHVVEDKIEAREKEVAKNTCLGLLKTNSDSAKALLRYLRVVSSSSSLLIK